MTSEITDREKRQRANIAIFNEFINDTYPIVREFDLTQIAKDSDFVAVIIEPREHPHLEYVIRNMMHFLGEGWGLHIVGSRTNKDFLIKILDGMGHVSVTILDVDNLNREEFRAMRKSVPYWQGLPGKKLLCFETDTLLCRYGIHDYTHFDYIGAPWSEGIAISDRVRVGNGGLSIRSKQAMIDMCIKGKPRVIPSEDSYFSLHLHLHKDLYNLPDVETAKTFSVESMYYPTPLGFHKAWMYLPRAEFLTILSSIDYQAKPD
jgi:hypothetical protein